MIAEKKYYSEVTKKFFNKELVMTEKDNENFKNSSKYWIFYNTFIDEHVKKEIIVIQMRNIEALCIDDEISMSSLIRLDFLKVVFSGGRWQGVI